MIWGVQDPSAIPQPPGTYTLNVRVVDVFPVAKPNTGAHVAISPVEQYYAAGTQVTLDARNVTMGDAYYVFNHWEGDLSGSNTPVTVTMDTNLEIIAYYADSSQPPPVTSPPTTPPTLVPTTSPDQPLYGDVNNSGAVDIVDALMTAQSYVGLNPPGFDPTYADVNSDGTVSIVDALIIAQYYVGLVPSLPV